MFPMSTVRLIFAGHRQIAVDCLTVLLEEGIIPHALLLPAHADRGELLRALLPNIPVVEGTAFRHPDGIAFLRDLRPDYLLSVHFPLLLPKEVLAIPRVGALNLHPALLPWNRGWHTPTWSIEEGTPFGVTLHWVDEGLDTGDIALQRGIPVLPSDTAHTLYQRALQTEVALFRDALPLLKVHALPRVPQSPQATMHRKSDLAALQQLDLQRMTGESLLRRLRALTTSKPEESAWFEGGGKRYHLCMHPSPDAGGLSLSTLPSAPPRIPIVLYGAGGHGKVIADMIERGGTYAVAGFLDERVQGEVMGIPVLGGREQIPLLRGKGITAAVVSIGKASVREALQRELSASGFTLPVIIHPSAQVARGVRLGPGTVVMPGAVIGPDTELGDGCIVNTCASVDHYCRIGHFVHIAPGAHLAGDVTVGDRVFIGIGSAVREGVTIGDNTLVGAGSVVVSDLPSGWVAYGSPAKPVRLKNVALGCDNR